jgi:hypothetical protein
MPAEVEVYVRERGFREDIGEWLEAMQSVITLDHRNRSPLCLSNVMEYAKIPAPRDGERIGDKRRLDS